MDVHDLILTGSTPTILYTLIQQLRNKIALKDLGPLTYFLSIEVAWIPTGLQLSQSKCIWDLLQHVNMHKDTAISILSSSQTLSATDSSHHFEDPTLFCQVVGALQCLAHTRPDITGTINKAAQFMHTTYINH
ncbi:uncharacterized mitochondrial protein AtMg00810-like [Jatropha curcas]|uniref:uncharacterized mitochondrial protein AtMg00810-like n=1 Tax=Jatropha curcas TaxID=180498 RepID=UPI0018962B39|nr:uncharacterized mitochondrial protein AtMg00810-like [Jatropha curcas]